MVNAGLTVNKRTPHAIPSSYVDKGKDATVSDDRYDFVFTNNTGADIDLSKLELDYFFTKDKDAELCFWCDHSALTSGGYTALTDSVKGAFSAASGKNADAKCAVTFGAGTLSAGGSLTLQARITRADWTDFDLGNDYSAGNAERILIKNGAKTIFGKKP